MCPAETQAMDKRDKAHGKEVTILDVLEERRTLRARVLALEKRLELDYYDANGNVVGRSDIGDTDGIGCRDETIKILSKNVETLREVRSTLESKLGTRTWKPIDPEHAPSVTVIIACGPIGEQWITAGNYVAGRWWSEGRQIESDVTHWMPLPEAPK